MGTVTNFYFIVNSRTSLYLTMFLDLRGVFYEVNCRVVPLLFQLLYIISFRLTSLAFSSVIVRKRILA